MSLRRPSAAVAVAFMLVLARPGEAAPWGLAPGEFYSELSGSFFSTESYFRNADEARTDLDGRFEQRMVSSHNEFGWKKWGTVWLDVPLVSRTFASDGGGSASSVGLGDIGLGLRWSVLKGSLPVAIELGWTAPLGTNRNLFPGTSGSGGLDGASLGAQMGNFRSDSSTFFSQGLQSLSASLELGAGLGARGYWTLGAGYRTRYLTIGSRAEDDRYADFFTGSAGLGWWFGRSLLASGEFRGEWQSAQGSPYDRVAAPVAGANGPELQSAWMLAGPRLTYRVDERMDVFAGTWHTPGGRNVLHHDLYYCGIAWKNTSLDRLAGALGGTKSR